MKREKNLVSRLPVWIAAMALAAIGPVDAQAPREAVDSPASIAESDVREWLTTLSADVMLGRGAFTEGYGLAAAYVAGQLEQIGATPLGIDGTFLRPVTRHSYRVTRNSTVSVTVGDETRTFTHGEHVGFPALAGSRQSIEFTGVDFVGYGLPGDSAPDISTDRLVVLLPGTPSALRGEAWPYPPSYTSVSGRAEALVREGAGATIALSAVPASTTTSGSRRATPAIDLTTVRDVDRPRAPVLTGDETFFEFLLAGSPVPFADLRDRAQRGETVEPFTLDDVAVTIDIDHTYEVITAERTHNVVAMVPGSDPVLRDTYVVFGAHLDHVGAASGGRAPGRVNVPVSEDPIWNGADDDGSGSAAVLAIAKAMMEGPRPKRSTVFVWHAGEEDGLLGSQTMVDSPPVPLEAVQAMFNIDMIGRNRDDDPALGDTVFVIGADRISTELHNVIVETNEQGSRPLTLDYHYNDPADTESFYTRSDHYSYASHGIPVAFFFTGPHPDYHANTDTVDKILFPKLVRIAQLIYQAGFNVADAEVALERDFRGPRAGRGFRGLLPGS